MTVDMDYPKTVEELMRSKAQQAVDNIRDLVDRSPTFDEYKLAYEILEEPWPGYSEIGRIYGDEQLSPVHQERADPSRHFMFDGSALRALAAGDIQMLAIIQVATQLDEAIYVPKDAVPKITESGRRGRCAKEIIRWFHYHPWMLVSRSMAPPDADPDNTKVITAEMARGWLDSGT